MLNSPPRVPISAVTDEKGVAQPVWTNWFSGIARLLGLAPTIYTGVIAPAFTPNKIGDTFVNTAAGKVYVSVGVTNSADWKILN